MSIEEKAKAYDEALGRAKKYHTPDSNNSNLKAVLEQIFPKLRESEDERMIRKIESFLSAYDVYYFKNDEWREIEVWLEKQKELSFVKDVILGYPGHYFYDGEKMHFCGSPVMEEKQKESLHISETCKENADSFTDEGERIRKDIINLIYWLKSNPSLCSQYYKDRYDGMLAWLEKQKEPDYPKRNALFDKCVESCGPEVMKAIEDVIRVYGKTQGEWIAGYDMDTLVVHLRKAFAALEKQKDAFENGRQLGIMQEQARQELEWPYEKK